MEDRKELLGHLLKAKFYGQCERHHNRTCNFFCRTCKGALLCDSCRNDPNDEHRSHFVFQVYKASEHAGLKVKDIGTYLNVTQIQPYKINCNFVVYIRARPVKGQSFRHRSAPMCKECGRELLALQDGGSSTFKFCSIECKSKNNDLTRLNCVQEEEEEDEAPVANNVNQANRKRASVDGEIVGNSTRRRRRKGVPVRSPLF